MKGIKKSNKCYGILKDNKYYAIGKSGMLEYRNYTLGWNLNNRSNMISFEDIYIQSGQETSSKYNGRISISYDRGNTWTLYSSSLPNGKTLSGNPVTAICIKDNNGNDCIAVSTDDYDTYIFDRNFTTLIGTIADGVWTHSLGWTWNPDLTSKGDCWIKGNSVNPSHVNLSTYEKTSIYTPAGISSQFPSCRYYGISSPKYYYINNSVLYESSSAEGPYTQSQISLPTITDFKALIGFKGKLLCICLNKIYYLDINNNWIECNINGIDMSTVTKMNLNINHNNDIYAVSVITGSLSCKIIYTLDGESWHYKDFNDYDIPIIRDNNYNINCGKIYDNNKVDLCITNSIGSTSTYYNFIIHCYI